MITEQEQKSRYYEVKELESLLNSFNGAKEGSPFYEQMKERIEDAFEKLYPEYEEIGHVIDEIIDDHVELTTWDQVARKSIDDWGLKAARKVWDNGLNQEYIYYIPFVGMVKKFFTAGNKGSGYKNVVHSYYPTEEDKVATDWYYL